MSKLADMAMAIQELHDAAAAIDDVANWLTRQIQQPRPQGTETQARAHAGAGTGGVGREIPRRSHGSNPRTAPEVRRRKALAGRPAAL